MELVRFLSAHNIEYKVKESVRKLSFAKIGGTAAIATYPKSRGELLCLLSYLYRKAIPYKVVGNMSNILPPDGFWGVCLVCTRKMREVSFENGLAVAECGVPLTALCRTVERAGLCPPASLIGIPATVGGAVYQNAGAFGHAIADFFVYADVFDPRRDGVIRLHREDLRFSYRASALPDFGILLCAAFRADLPCDAEKTMDEVLAYRRKNHPSKPSLGSVFLRVGQTSAAYYIDRAGLKGCRIGDAAVSSLHAGFILNEDNATARDYLALVAFVKQRVYEAFEIRLQTEIEIIEGREENLWLHSV